MSAWTDEEEGRDWLRPLIEPWNQGHIREMWLFLCLSNFHINYTVASNSFQFSSAVCVCGRGGQGPWGSSPRGSFPALHLGILPGKYRGMPGLGPASASAEASILPAALLSSPVAVQFWNSFLKWCSRFIFPIKYQLKRLQLCCPWGTQEAPREKPLPGLK